MKAATIPTPAEELETQTLADEAELNKLREASESQEAEELAEESLPSEDEEETQPEPDEGEEEAEPIIEDQESEPKLSERGQKRFQKLSEERKTALEENQRLQEENQNLYSVVQALQNQGYTQQEAQDIAPQIEQGYIDPQRYQQDVAQQAQKIVNQTLTQREAVQARIKSAEKYTEDLKVVEEKHPILNEDSPEYDDKLSGFIADLYTSRVAKNPSVRLTDVTEEVMAIRNKAAEDKSKEEVGKVAKQASRQAMSPTGGKSDTTSLEDKVKAIDNEADLLEIRKQLPQE